jgi:hypothetical protein
MGVFAIGVILIIAFMVTAAAVNSVAMGLRGIRNRRTAMLLPAGVLGLFGVGGFFGAALSSMGGLDFLGSFEWPIGYTSGVVRLPDGRYVVPHTPSGRVQVYDRDLHFQRGWRINASGGTFAVRASPDGKIKIDTARGDRHLVYDPDGRLLLEGTYPQAESRARLTPPADALTLTVPTSWWKWPLTGPFYGWLCFLAALGLWGLHDRLTRPPPERSDDHDADAAADTMDKSASTARRR